jgi:transcriptional regulator with XRE-family HTH domain
VRRRLDIVNELCAAIEQDRRSAHMIAQQAGIGTATIGKWLSGDTNDPRVETLDKVARVLGRRIAWIDDHFVLTPITAAALDRARRPRMALWRYQRV